MKSSIAVLLLLFLVLVSCKGGQETRRFEWSGLEFQAGNELHYFLTPLDESLVSENAKGKTVPVLNNGTAFHEFNFAGRGLPGRVYYWVDGDEDDVCEENGQHDILGVKEFPDDELITKIRIDMEASTPAGTCLWFNASRLARSPIATPTATQAPTVPNATPTPSPTPEPDWVAIHGDAPFDVFTEYLEAWGAFDISRAQALAIEEIHSSIEFQLNNGKFLTGNDPTFIRKYDVVEFRDVECFEDSCTFNTDTLQNTPESKGYEIVWETVMVLENGEWKVAR